MKYKLINDNILKNYGEELLKQRGIDNVQLFLHPDESCLQSWKDLTNIEKGINLVKQTINSPGAYAIIGDCDMDGVASFAILYQYLKRLNPNKEIDWFIHSGKQHGLSDQIENLEGKDYEVIWCPDSGSNDGKYVEMFPNSIICCLDHHILEDDSPVPNNMIIINNQTSPNYHNKDLCGGGVTWQFCRALDYLYNNDWAKDYVDLCALSLIGDMMSMLNYENQYLVKKGLQCINNFAFQVLVDKQSFSMGGRLNPTTIAFYVVPLVNAMIRVGTMEEKKRLYEAFIDGEKLIPSHKRGANGSLERLAIESARECTNAKAAQDRTKEKVVSKLEGKIFEYGLLDNEILFIRLEDDDIFPSELNGLCAMSISAKYHKPVIIARLNDEGFDRGSARAPSNTELESFKQYLANTGLFEYTLGQ